MDQLLTASPLQIDGRDRSMFYAQSWLFAHYLLLTPAANTQFLAYVRAMRSGRPPLEAFQEGFGVTPDQMQSTLRLYLRGNPNAIAPAGRRMLQHREWMSPHCRPAPIDLCRSRRA
jgi:hypothetical protein